MNAQVQRLPSGHFRLARIVYFTQLGRSDSAIIPLGVAAEVTLDNGLLGIGTAMRPRLADEELGMVGPWMREALRSPFDTLWPQMENALMTAPAGMALAEFSALHHSSLSVLAPLPLEVPKQWLLQADMDELIAIVTQRLKVTLTEQYYELLFPPRIEIAQQPPREEERLRQAA